jgi:hypothetical protein
MEATLSNIIGIMTRNMTSMGNRNWARKNTAPRIPATSVKRRLELSDR